MLDHKAATKEKIKSLENHKGACEKYCNAMITLFSDENQKLPVMLEIIRDDSFLQLIGILNDLTKQEISVSYLIFKNMIKSENEEIKLYLKLHFEMIVNSLLNNLNSIHDNYSIIIVGKEIRKLMKNKNFLENILNFGILQKLFVLSESDNFILSKECLKVISFLFESPKISSDIVSDYIEKKETDVSALFTEHAVVSEEEDQQKKDRFYYLQRESLRLLENIYKNPKFENFTKKASNNLSNLKKIMILLNNKSNKIMVQAIYLLAFFFNDIEYKTQRIRETLLSNKTNFEQFFAHNNIPEIEETKNCILYELERLNNLLEK